MKKKNSILLITVSTLFVFLQAGGVLAEDIVIDQNTIWTEGTYTYENVHITNGATLTFDGKVTLNAQNLTIDPASSISADGKGHGPCNGPGAGDTKVRSVQGFMWWDTFINGGGGGYGGKGGDGGDGAIGGPAYGSFTEPEDLGSGGGTIYYSNVAWNGGAGGGAIRITAGTLTVAGSISANGNNGTDWSGGGINWTYIWGGGGSGGSIYLTTSALTGSGPITANGGDGAGGGGAGGRIAIYYNASTFNGNISANGGTGSQPGEDGTALINTQLLNASSTAADLSEKSASQATLIETLISQKAVMNDVIVSGDMNGVIDFTDFEIVSVETGPFTGKGFSKGQFQSTLEGLPYAGEWKGLTFFVPSERKIYLKGAVSGDISAIVEGYLSESVPDSNVFDQYQATWKLSRVGNETVSGTINLSGTINYQEGTEYPSTELYILQTCIEGATIGHYTGPLSTVLTHLRVDSQDNPYYGEGFSIISYVSNIGQGEAWAYNNLTSTNISQLSGFLTSPIEGILTGTLDETTSPRTLTLTVERIDLGLPPAPDLKVITWGPTRVSPGQTINYIIEYRNDGLIAGEDVFIVKQLSPLVEFVGASNGSYYSPISHEVSWNLSRNAKRFV